MHRRAAGCQPCADGRTVDLQLVAGTTLLHRPLIASRSCPLTDILRRFRGLAIALVVLAMSAGVVLAAAPLTQPSASHGPNAEDPSAGDEDGDEQDRRRPRARRRRARRPSPRRHETPDAADKQDAGTGDGERTERSSSAAAHMPTPAGFPNHGAFVSCVAHLKDATLATIDWTFVTPEACAAGEGEQGRGPCLGQAREGRGEGGARGGEGRSQGCQGRSQGGEAGREGTTTRWRRRGVGAGRSGTGARASSGRCPRSARRRSRSPAAAWRSSGTWRGSPGRSGRSRRGRPGSG